MNLERFRVFDLNESIMKYHNRALSCFWIANKFHMAHWEVNRIITEQIEKDKFNMGLS